MFQWDAVGERNGVLMKARFFDPEQLETLTGPVQRPLCFLPGTSAMALWIEQDRRNVRWGRVVAQSDGVYRLGSGLLNLEYKTRSKRSVNRTSWLAEVRLKDVLQCLVATVSVA